MYVYIYIYIYIYMCIYIYIYVFLPDRRRRTGGAADAKLPFEDHPSPIRVGTEVTFGQGALSIFPLAYFLGLLIDDLGIWAIPRVNSSLSSQAHLSLSLSLSHFRTVVTLKRGPSLSLSLCLSLSLSLSLSLPCSGRCGLGGPPRPCRPRLKWNKASEARLRRQGEGGHQAVRYNSTQHDGRWLCMRCGLHYARFCDLRTKRCTGAPACQAAAKAIADALAGGPLTRRKVHAFAKHPSGSRPGAGALGARLPSDQLVLDPSVPRPPGLAAPQVQADAPTESQRRPQEDDPNAGHPSAGAPARAEQTIAPELGDPLGHEATGPAYPAQDDAHGGPKPDAGDPSPDVAHEQQGRGSAHTCEQDGRPQDIHALLGRAQQNATPLPAGGCGRGRQSREAGEAQG